MNEVNALVTLVTGGFGALVVLLYDHWSFTKGRIFPLSVVQAKDAEIDAANKRAERAEARADRFEGLLLESLRANNATARTAAKAVEVLATPAPGRDA